VTGLTWRKGDGLQLLTPSERVLAACLLEMAVDGAWQLRDERIERARPSRAVGSETVDVSFLRLRRIRVSWPASGARR